MEAATPPQNAPNMCVFLYNIGRSPTNRCWSFSGIVDWEVSLFECTLMWKKTTPGRLQDILQKECEILHLQSLENDIGHPQSSRTSEMIGVHGRLPSLV